MRLSGLQKCDKLHVFDIVEEMKRKHFFTEYATKFMKQKLIHFACVNLT